jgi:hypothetical protein
MIGTAFLHQHQPLDGVCLPLVDDALPLLEAERDRYGIAHDQVGARVLAAWHFPERVCALIGRHHEPTLPHAAPLELSLSIARTITDCLLTGTAAGAGPAGQLAWLTEGRLGEQDLVGLLERVTDRSSALLDGLMPRR